MKNKILKVAFVVGEVSGDNLAADLVPELKLYAKKQKAKLQLVGLGGEKLKAQGLKSLFKIDEIALMGFSAVIKKLPMLIKKIHQTANYIVQQSPDIILLVDSPDFCHAVAKRVKKLNKTIPIYQYVCPSVWAWRSWRAKRMKKFITHVFALLPFEVAALKKLKGPSATYVGHPLMAEKYSPAQKLTAQPILLVLPGSRQSETSRLLPLFIETLNLLKKQNCQFKAVLPAVPHLRNEITRQIKKSNCQIKIVPSSENKKLFKKAHLALAASGTVSLQLALHNVPMVIAYKLDIFARVLSPLLRNTWSIVLPNLIYGKKIVPEYIDNEASPQELADSLQPLLCKTKKRQQQLSAFKIIAKKMKTTNPSRKIITEVLAKKSKRLF